jgi:hypothetical protein
LLRGTGDCERLALTLRSAYYCTGIFHGYLAYNEAEFKALKSKGGAGAGKDKKKKK